MCPGLSNTGEQDCHDTWNKDPATNLVTTSEGYFCDAGEALPRICPEGKITTSLSMTAQDDKDTDCLCLDSSKFVKTPLI